MTDHPSVSISPGVHPDDMTTSTPETPTPTKRRRWILPAAALVLVLLAGGAYLLWPRGVTITGTVQLNSGRLVDSTGGQCTGLGGYADLHNGTQVVVSDAGGDVLGVTRLADGEMRDSATCRWTFTVSVPERDFYGVKVADRNVLQYTRDDVRQPLALVIGS